jgi:hypothetical protein
MKLPTVFRQAGMVLVILSLGFAAPVAVSVFAQQPPALTPPPAAPAPTNPATDAQQAAEAKLEGFLLDYTIKFKHPAPTKNTSLSGGPTTYSIPFTDGPVNLLVSPRSLAIPDALPYSYHTIECWCVLLPARPGVNWSPAMLEKIAEANGTSLSKIGILGPQGAILVYETFHLEVTNSLDFAAHLERLVAVSVEWQKPLQAIQNAEQPAATPGATSGPSAATSLNARPK